MTKPCYYCEKVTDEEMRPYGPGGSWIHFSCTMAEPAREQAAYQMFFQQMVAAGDGVIILGEETGPRLMEGGKQ